jgi:hypothetical protein
MAWSCPGSSWRQRLRDRRAPTSRQAWHRLPPSDLAQQISQALVQQEARHRPACPLVWPASPTGETTALFDPADKALRGADHAVAAADAREGRGTLSATSAMPSCRVPVHIGLLVRDTLARHDGVIRSSPGRCVAPGLHSPRIVRSVFSWSHAHEFSLGDVPPAGAHGSRLPDTTGYLVEMPVTKVRHLAAEARSLGAAEMLHYGEARRVTMTL